MEGACQRGAVIASRFSWGSGSKLGGRKRAKRWREALARQEKLTTTSRYRVRWPECRPQQRLFQTEQVSTAQKIANTRFRCAARPFCCPSAPRRIPPPKIEVPMRPLSPVDPIANRLATSKQPESSHPKPPHNHENSFTEHDIPCAPRLFGVSSFFSSLASPLLRILLVLSSFLLPKLLECASLAQANLTSPKFKLQSPLVAYGMNLSAPRPGRPWRMGL